MDRKKNKMKRDYIVPEIIVMKMDAGELLSGSAVPADSETTTDEQWAPKYYQPIDDESVAAGGFGK